VKTAIAYGRGLPTLLKLRCLTWGFGVQGKWMAVI